MNGLGGDGWPDGRPPEPVPGLPPEWGPIVIPDDPAELAAEAEAVRRELRLAYRTGPELAVPPQWGLAGHRSHRGGRPSALASLRLAVLLMLVAMLTTLASLFAIRWQNPQSQPTSQRPAVRNSPISRFLPALDLVDEAGHAVPLRGLLPAVIIMVEDCICADQITSVAAIAPAPVTVAAVTTGRTAPQPAVVPAVRALADPASELRGLLPSDSPPGRAAALLVARSGEIVRALPNLGDAEDYRADLEHLADR